MRRRRTEPGGLVGVWRHPQHHRHRHLHGPHAQHGHRRLVPAHDGRRRAQLPSAVLRLAVGRSQLAFGPPGCRLLLRLTRLARMRNCRWGGTQHAAACGNALTGVLRARQTRGRRATCRCEAPSRRWGSHPGADAATARISLTDTCVRCTSILMYRRHYACVPLVRDLSPQEGGVEDCLQGGQLRIFHLAIWRL